MEKAVYTVSTAALYEHASLELATSEYDAARRHFDYLVGLHGDWVTVILQEWYSSDATTIDIERVR